MRKGGGHGPWAVPLVLILTLYGVAAPAVSAPPAVRLDADVGVAGWVVPGVWVPLRIDVGAVTPFEGDVIAEVPVGVRGTTVASYRHPVRLGAGASQRVHIDVIIDDPRRPVVVRAVSGGQELSRRSFPVGTARAVEGIVAALTRDAAGLEFLADRPRKIRPAYIREDHLPLRWQGYGGVEVLVVRDLDERRVLPAQQQALIEWVNQGGSLLVTGAEQLALLQAPWLLALLPATPTGSIRTLSSAAVSEAATPVAVAVVTPRRGATVRTEDGTPVVLWWRRGRGSVTVWTFDAFAPAARAWPGRTALWWQVLDAVRVTPVAAADLAAALPSAQPLSGRAQAVLALLAVVYIVSVRRVLRAVGARRAGWIGAVGLAAIFGLVLYGVAIATRGSTLSSAQLSIVEVIPDVGMARVTTYVSVISPYGGQFRLQAPEGGTIRAMGSASVTYGDDAGLAEGHSPAGGLAFEVTQMLPLPARGVLRDDTITPEVDIDNRSGVAVRAPAVYFDDRLYPLPDFNTTFAASLDPAKWESVPPGMSAATDWRTQARHAVYARLRKAATDASGMPHQAWLVGEVTDGRLAAHLIDARAEPSLRLLLVPIEVR